MEQNKIKVENLYYIFLVLAIIFGLLFVSSFIMIFINELGEKLQSLCLGLSGVFSSFSSAFFIAYIVKQNDVNKQNKEKKERVLKLRRFYLYEIKNTIKELSYIFITSTNNYNGLKNIFLDKKLNIKNLTYNIAFTCIAKNIINEKKLKDLKKIFPINAGKKDTTTTISSNSYALIQNFFNKFLEKLKNNLNKVIENFDREKNLNMIDIYNSNESMIFEKTLTSLSIIMQDIDNMDIRNVIIFEEISDFSESIFLLVDDLGVEFSTDTVESTIKELLNKVSATLKSPSFKKQISIDQNNLNQIYNDVKLFIKINFENNK